MSTLSRSGSSFLEDENTITLLTSRINNASNNNGRPSSSSSSAKRSLKSTYLVNKKEVIGQGSWGIVRKCQHRQTKQWFAVKTIHKAQIPKDEADILQQEVSNLERAKGHAHLVELVDVFEDRRSVHIVTELLTGGELYQRVIDMAHYRTTTTTPMKQTTFSMEDAAWMVRNILDAIRHLHEVCHVVHRDLKASNFLFATRDNPRSIKIIDFGLSKHIDDDDDEDYNNDNGGVGEERLTGCVGTPYYVAPEVLTYDPNVGYTNKCDVWSVGVIAYLILSASLPFQGADERETVKILMTESELEADFPESKWKHVEPMAVDFCKYLLQKDPIERPTARQAMLHPWIVHYCGKPPSPSPIGCKEKPNRTEKTLDMDSEVDLQSIPSVRGFTCSLSEAASWSP